tara:strand:+ start:311 stop:571 length:261 start_codon:yes stop_codon:yes gene_type:complete
MLFICCGRSINNSCDCYEWKREVENENGLNSSKSVFKNESGKRFIDLDVYSKFEKECVDKYGFRLYEMCASYSQYEYMEINEKYNK